MNAEERFHELAVKEALETITPEEQLMLERYSKLRELLPNPYEKRRVVEIELTLRKARKMRGKLIDYRNK